jgi:hypothetical protein
MKTVSTFCLLLLLCVTGAIPVGAEPSLVYSTPLSGGISDLAVDSAGNAYVLGFRGTPGFGHFLFLAKLSPLGELIFLRQLELPLEDSMKWRELSAVALDPAGYIYLAGVVEYEPCPDHDPYTCTPDGSYSAGFVAKLGPDGTGLFYDTIFWEGHDTQPHDLAVDALGRAHVRTTSRWPDRYGVPISGGIRFSPAGSIQGYFGYSAYLWSYGPTAMAMGPSGDLFTVGWGWEDYYDPYSAAAYLQRTDASSGAVVEILFGDDGTIEPVDVAGTPGGGSVVVGTVGQTVDSGVPGDGGFYIAELGPAGEEIFSRVLNLGTVKILDIAVASSGRIVLAGATWSNNLLRDPFILLLEGGTGEVVSSMPGGSAVAVGPGGDVYMARNGYVSRFTENRPPDCSGATASPSVIWPPNGKMIPVSILGVTDPEGDPVALKITGISQDEPGAAFSGIGSSVAQVKAERDGKGDGRVYHILFEATDPSGASCAGEVTVCVPRDQSGRSCVDGMAGRP